MTGQYIDKADAAAARQKAVRALLALAAAEIAKAAFDIAGQDDEALVNARRDAMAAAIIKGLDDVERQFLHDLDTLSIELGS